MDDIAVQREKSRLEAILERADVPQQHRDVLIPVVENMAWQRLKLIETMEQIKDSPVAVEYNNGGGQSGVRENPIFKGYATLWKSYTTGLSVFTSYLPKEIEEEVIKEDSVLDKVIRMKQA